MTEEKPSLTGPTEIYSSKKKKKKKKKKGKGDNENAKSRNVSTVVYEHISTMNTVLLFNINLVLLYCMGDTGKRQDGWCQDQRSETNTRN